MKILLLDIETSPNLAHVWGLWKQNVGINQLIDSSYTMCWAAKWYTQKEVQFMSVHDNSHEDVIKAIHALLCEADVVVHYNGTKFDMPTLNKEFLKHKLPPPDPYKQVDLLLVTKKQFRFPSNKLDYVSQQLGIGKKHKHIGHELWIQCMANDARAWKTMEKYNKQDVKLLEKLYAKLLPWITSHPNVALYGDALPSSPSCTNCGSTHVIKRGVEHTKTLSYQRYKCKKCGTNLRGRFAERTDKESRENILTQVK